MTYVTDSLAKMNGLNKSRRDFMSELLTTMLALPGKMNFRNLGRFGPYSERSYARHFARTFDFLQFNQMLLQERLGNEVIAALDTSFIPKSGKKTFGLDRFFDTRIRKARPGLEVSALALVDVTTRNAYTLSACQTPAFAKTKTAPPKSERRLIHYIKQLDHIPSNIRYLAADGAYARKEFIEAVRLKERHLVTRLRCDANLRYLFQGPSSIGKGRKKRYDGKVDLSDVSRMQLVGALDEDIELYTALVNSPHMKQDFRIAYVRNRHKPEQYVVLASTDLKLGARKIVEYYSLRFQIEMIFRDAKQHTGLCDCQARSQDKLDFHFNAALTALNVARLNWYEKERNTFSMASIKRISFNELFMDQIFLQLGLESELLKMHPAFEKLRSFGAIAA